MWNKKCSIILSIVTCFIVSAIITVGLFLGPWVIKTWFTSYRGWNAGSFQVQDAVTLFKFAFYPSAVFAYIILYNLIKLLFNIKNEQIFIENNIKHLRRISWGCIAVAFITLASGLFYIPYLFVAVAAGFLGLMLRIVKNAFQSAVTLREENDLTI